MTTGQSNFGPQPLTSKNTHQKSLDILSTRIKGLLLDAPAGQGAFSEKWISRGGSVVALEREPPPSFPELPLVVADLNHGLPFREESFAAVSCIDGIEHLENPFRIAREFHRILKNRGYLLISTPNIQEIRSRTRFFFSGFYNKYKRPLDESKRSFSHHITPVTYPQLRYILKTTGFTIECITVNRIKFQSMLYIPFLPFIKIYTWISLTVRERDPVKKKVNRRIAQELTRVSTLLGETLIILARKRD